MARGSTRQQGRVARNEAGGQTELDSQPEIVWDRYLRTPSGDRLRTIPIGRAIIDVANGQSIPALEAGKSYDFEVKNSTTIGRTKVKVDKDGYIELDLLEAITRGGGREAVNAVIDLANRMKLPIYLWAQPLNPKGGKKMKQEELVEWYRGFGFKPQAFPPQAMIREPN